MSDLYDGVLHLPPLGRSDLIHPKVRTKIKSSTRRRAPNEARERKGTRFKN